MVQPACRTRGSRSSIACEVSWSRVSPSPRPTRAWGAIVQTRSADGRIARPVSPPAMRKQPTATSTWCGGCRRRASGARAERRERHDRHRQGRRRRGVAPALDQEQDQQEQGSGERGRQQRERQVGTHRRTVPVRRDRRDGAYGERGRHREHGDRHLHHEDGLPRERLGEQSTRDRPDGRADHPGSDPGRDAATLAPLRDHQLQASDQRKRAPDRLHAPGRDQHVDRAGHRTATPTRRRTPRSRRR